MTNKRILLIINVFSLVLISPAFSSEAISISGIVLDTKGKPVKKAEIKLVDADKKKSASTKTDKKGTFTLEGIKAQNYTLIVNKKK